MSVFITLEGGEGSGKSTVAPEIARRLRAAGREVVLTNEPGGTALGQHFWAYLRDPLRPALSALAELFVFEAARAEHVATVIRPALERGAMVVCDRFGDSSVAYQGHGRRLGTESVERLNAIATGGLQPGLTLLLDVPVEIGLRRARSLEGDGAKLTDAIGAESLEFHRRVRDGFAMIAAADPGRIAVIDASKPLSEVIEHSWKAVSRLVLTAP